MAGVRYRFMVQGSKVLNPDRQIDCVGLFCPMPIVRTREAIQQMAVGQLLEMRADDPASEPDMKSWVQITGHDLVGMAREGGIYRFLVRKTR
ncbi:MAG TPA: sulfurtransferase TusA family protein [Methylomirabilota bacterium]|nr:sulfurtransferase TusA family protein [Methylomirabilota bacterium]